MRKRDGLKGALGIGLIGLLLGGCAFLEAGPVARFEVRPLVLYAGEGARFDASSASSDQAIVSYRWDFGDGETAAGGEVDHTYAQAGRYGVTLRVRDAEGRTGKTTGEVVVYLRSGRELFFEDFAKGTASLARFSLDPAWASAGEGTIENLTGLHGFVLHIASGIDRWHRRSAAVTLPPLRDGQRLVFSFAVMTAHTQDAHTFFLFPARTSLDSTTGALPYFVYTSAGGGSTLRVPDGHGGEETHLVPFQPGVYLWHTYAFSFSSDEYSLYVDDVLYASGKLPTPPGEGEGWLIVLGDESHTEASSAYFDDIKVTVEE